MTREPHPLPRIATAVPGPKSIALSDRLTHVESRNITSREPAPPVFWEQAWNATVVDVDGNIYIDLTSGFGVAFAGHACPRVTKAIAQQAGELAHGLGDVYPPAIKVRLLEKLAEIAPGDLSVCILGSDGADAVEAALKTAALRTGRRGVLAFEGAYHGLTYGALSVTWREEFRGPFQSQLNDAVHFAPYPAGNPDPSPGSLAASLHEVEHAIARADEIGDPIGAIVVEPIQGRGGLVVPPTGFLERLRELCDGESRILIFDEIYTGIGRTGDWFACERSRVVPDILTVGKALTGSIPLSAAIGTPAVMDAWPRSTGEAIHTSTFLGNPIACAAALAQLEEIEAAELRQRATHLGQRIAERGRRMVDAGLARANRGEGLLQGIRVQDAETGLAVVRAALQRGVLLLAEGAGDVLAITPPACITGQQLDFALDVIEDCLARVQRSDVSR